MNEELVMLAVRTLLLITLPLVLVVTIAGAIVAGLQSATNLHEPAIGYAARLVAILGLMVLLLPDAIQSVLSLAEAVLK